MLSTYVVLRLVTLPIPGSITQRQKHTQTDTQTHSVRGRGKSNLFDKQND